MSADARTGRGPVRSLWRRDAAFGRTHTRVRALPGGWFVSGPSLRGATSFACAAYRRAL